MLQSLFTHTLIVFLFSMVGFTFQAGASQFPSFMKHPSFEEGFFWPDNLDKKPEGIKNAYDASIAFPLGFSNCSSSYISPDGFILTAFHCLISGMGLDSYRQELADGAEMYLVPQQEVIGKKYSHFFDQFNATVIAAGRGFGQFDERKVNKFDPSILKKVQDVTGADWAILKMDGVSNHACLKTAASTPVENEYSWVIGYPGLTKRKIGEATNNWKKLVSYGKVAYSAEQSGYYKTLEESNRRLSLDFWKVLIDRGEYIVTDSDVQGGNSGSPVINDRSELIGLLVQGLIPDQSISYDNYNTYTAGVIQLAFIRKSLGEEKFKKYFTCQ